MSKTIVFGKHSVDVDELAKFARWLEDPSSVAIDVEKSMALLNAGLVESSRAAKGLNGLVELKLHITPRGQDLLASAHLIPEDVEPEPSVGVFWSSDGDPCEACDENGQQMLFTSTHACDICKGTKIKPTARATDGGRDRQEFGAELADAISSSTWTVSQVAERVGVLQATVWAWIEGRFEPTQDQLAALANLRLDLGRTNAIARGPGLACFKAAGVQGLNGAGGKLPIGPACQRAITAARNSVLDQAIASIESDTPIDSESLGSVLACTDDWTRSYRVLEVEFSDTRVEVEIEASIDLFRLRRCIVKPPLASEHRQDVLKRKVERLGVAATIVEIKSALSAAASVGAVRKFEADLIWLSRTYGRRKRVTKKVGFNQQ